jgi:hypothetical protein
VSRDVVNVVAENRGRAGRWINESHQELEGGCFPCAVRAEEAEDFAALDRKRQPVKRAHLALTPKADLVVLRQSFNLNGR